MNDLDYILKQINSGPLFKHWERDYSVFFCSSWGKVHAITANSDFFGESSLNLVLNPYRHGTSQYYRLWKDNEVYLKVLGNKFKNKPGFLAEIIDAYSRHGEKMLAIFEELKEREVFDGNFVKKWAEATSQLIGHQILLFHRSDNYELFFKNNPEIIESIYAVRKKYEPAFGLLETNFEIMCQKILKNKNKVNLKQLKVLTPEEFVNFLDNNVLPEDTELRDEQMVISHIPSTKIFVGREAQVIVDSIRANELKNEKQLLDNSVINGRTVFGKGVISGKCQVITDYKKISEFKKGNILVTPSTLPKYNNIYQKAKAIITNEGSVLSHVAILCREFKIPGIIGTKVATNKLKTGDILSLDFNKGTINIHQKK